MVSETDRRTPPLAFVSLYARLLLEALWTLRWIGNRNDRARKFALCRFRQMADALQASIVQAKAKLPGLAEAAIENRRAIEQDAARYGVKLDAIERWPIGSYPLEKKLKGDKGIFRSGSSWSSAFSGSLREVS
jgi:hypothetical protein